MTKPLGCIVAASLVTMFAPWHHGHASSCFLMLQAHVLSQRSLWFRRLTFIQMGLPVIARMDMNGHDRSPWYVSELLQEIYKQCGNMCCMLAVLSYPSSLLSNVRNQRQGAILSFSQDDVQPRWSPASKEFVYAVYMCMYRHIQI